MLHDIGIFLTHAPSIACTGSEPYPPRNPGAALLREAGAGEMMARVAELHTGSGLTSAEITQQKLPLPARDYLPSSLLEKLICYADKFYSKSGDMKRKNFDRCAAPLPPRAHLPQSASTVSPGFSDAPPIPDPPPVVHNEGPAGNDLCNLFPQSSQLIVEA